MKKPTLVDNWKQAWRWFSVQANLLNMAFLATWALLPAKFQDALPEWLMFSIAGTLLALGVAGRLVTQDKPAPGADV
jgi:hypothetical protein